MHMPVGKEIPAENLEAAYNEIASAVGPERITRNKAIMETYAGGHSFKGLIKTLPDMVIQPRSTEDVQKILEQANKYKIPCVPITSATMQYDTFPRSGGIVIDFSQMKRILEVNTDSDYAFVEAGVTIGQLTKELREKGYWAPFGSFPPWTCVVGNYMQRHHASIRTSGIFNDIMGFEAVLGDGTMLRTGSGAFKDAYSKTSWFSQYGPHSDFNGLFLCNYGQFGVVTKAAIRIYPLNEEHDFVCFASDSYGKSVEFARKFARTGAVEQAIIWHWGMYMMFDVLTGARKKPNPKMFNKPWDPPDSHYYNLVTLQMSGFKETLGGNRDAAHRVAKEMGGEILPHDELQERFPGAWRYFSKHMLDKWPSTYFMAGFIQFTMFPILMAAPSRMVELEPEGLKRCWDKKLRMGLTYYSQPFDRARATTMRYTPFTNPLDEKSCLEGLDTLNDFHVWASKEFGALPLRIFPSQCPDYFQNMGGFADLWRRIKEITDPNGILSPGNIV